MTKASKVQYSEPEAAAMLGLSVEQLRSLVRDHIVKEESGKDEDSPPIPAVPSFQASDLVVLRILAKMPRLPRTGRG